jgi:hypothetical protein
VLAYFNATTERRQRFVVVDVEGWADEDVTLPMRWVTRRSLGKIHTPELLVEAGQARKLLDHLRPKAELRLHEAPRKPESEAVTAAHRSTPTVVQGNSTVVQANPRDHPKQSERNVKRALRHLVGCPQSMWQDELYAKCAAYSEKSVVL